MNWKRLAAHSPLLIMIAVLSVVLGMLLTQAFEKDVPSDGQPARFTCTARDVYLEEEARRTVGLYFCDFGKYK